MVRKSRKILGIILVCIIVIAPFWITWEMGATRFITPEISNYDTRIFTFSSVNNETGEASVSGANWIPLSNRVCYLRHFNTTPIIATGDIRYNAVASWTLDYSLTAFMGYANIEVMYFLFDSNFISLDYVQVFSNSIILGSIANITTQNASDTFQYETETHETYYLGVALGITLVGPSSVGGSQGGELASLSVHFVSVLNP